LFLGSAPWQGTHRTAIQETAWGSFFLGRLSATDFPAPSHLASLQNNIRTLASSLTSLPALLIYGAALDVADIDAETRGSFHFERHSIDASFCGGEV
jgi:hypothetical protein